MSGSRGILVLAVGCVVALGVLLIALGVRSRDHLLDPNDP